MPDYRKLYNSAGHSEKVSGLTDLEFRVWIQMRASADDFGVGPMIPGKLQGDNRRLAQVPSKAITRSMDLVVSVSLLETFTHQGQVYYFQADWQDREGVGYPKRSVYPYPPLDRVSEKTRKLIREAEKSFARKRKKVFEKSDHLAHARTRGNGTASNPLATDPEGVPGKPDTEFDAFWSAYPRKNGKDAARKAWRNRHDRPNLSVLLRAIEAQKRLPQWVKDDGQFIPYPATWINQGRWQDSATVTAPSRDHVEREFAESEARRRGDRT